MKLISTSVHQIHVSMAAPVLTALMDLRAIVPWATMTSSVPQMLMNATAILATMMELVWMASTGNYFISL